MTVKSQRRPGAQPAIVTAPALYIAPTPRLAPLHCQSVEIVLIASCGVEGRAEIGERQRNAPAAPPQAGDFHDWQHFFQLPICKAAKVSRTVAMGFVEHARPGASVEKRTAGMHRQQRIPSRVLQGINRDNSLRARGWGYGANLDFSRGRGLER